MSQADILLLLRANSPRWMTIREIASELGSDRLLVAKKLTRLSQWFDEVEISTVLQDNVVMDPRTHTAIKRKNVLRIARSIANGRGEVDERTSKEIAELNRAA